MMYLYLYLLLILILAIFILNANIVFVTLKCYSSTNVLCSIEILTIVTYCELIINILNRFLQSNLSYIDKNKIGIWGWSFGGYIAGMVLAKDVEQIFKCALSVAPVTDWIYYGFV